MAMLFSQMAVAGYICPAMHGEVVAAADEMAGMPCATKAAAGGSLDDESPNLCLQHCQFGSVGHLTDPPSQVLATALALAPTFTVRVEPAPDHLPGSWGQRERDRDRPPPLAHSLAHCCLRL